MLRVAIESCPTTCFLANPQIDRAVYRELFHLNEIEADAIATLVPRQQILLKQPGVAKVLNLRVDAESARLFSAGASRGGGLIRCRAPEKEERCLDDGRCAGADPGERRHDGPARGAIRRLRPIVAHGARTLVYHPRDLIALRAKLHYTTLIVLPDGDDVVEATCGDKEFWIVNARGPLVSVKPAKAGSETNLNLLTTSGQVYAFVLTEISAMKGQDPDLTVYLDPDEPASVRRPDTSGRSTCPRSRSTTSAPRPSSRARTRGARPRPRGRRWSTASRPSARPIR